MESLDVNASRRGVLKFLSAAIPLSGFSLPCGDRGAGQSTDLQSDLNAAAKANNVAGIERAIALGARVNASTEYSGEEEYTYQTALARAVDDGCFESVTCLLKHKADPNIDRVLNLIRVRVLSTARSLPMVKVLWDNGARINTSEHSFSSLAIDHLDRVEILKFLIDRGLDLESKDNFFENHILPLAVGFDASEEAIRLLLESGATFGETPGATWRAALSNLVNLARMGSE